MKTVKVSFRSIALGLCLLAANAFAVSNLIQVGSPQYSTYGAFWNNGTINSVPAGAYFEWEVESSGSGSYAQILVGGGGLNVNQSVGAGGFASDAGQTSYADNISYQLNTSTGSYPDRSAAMV